MAPPIAAVVLLATATAKRLQAADALLPSPPLAAVALTAAAARPGNIEASPHAKGSMKMETSGMRPAPARAHAGNVVGLIACGRHGLPDVPREQATSTRRGAHVTLRV